MPNHVSQKLTFRYGENDYKEKAEAWVKVLNFMKTKDRDFDFSALIPYPEKWAKLDKAHHEAEEALLKLPQEQRDWRTVPKDGYNQGGYEWCIKNWGTKWNAYTLSINWDEITFQTAWSYPTPIYEALSKKFPETIFEVEYADDDFGANCGITAWQNGVEIERRDNQSEPAYPWYEFAHRLYYEVELNAERKQNKELHEEITKLKGGNA